VDPYQGVDRTILVRVKYCYINFGLDLVICIPHKQFVKLSRASWYYLSIRCLKRGIENYSASLTHQTSVPDLTGPDPNTEWEFFMKVVFIRISLVFHCTSCESLT
jgi:hypothetical protein